MSYDRLVVIILVYGFLGTKAGDGVWKGIIIVVSVLVKEEDCLLLKGMEVGFGGVGGDNVDFIRVEGVVGVIDKGFLFLFW